MADIFLGKGKDRTGGRERVGQRESVGRVGNSADAGGVGDGSQPPEGGGCPDNRIRAGPRKELTSRHQKHYAISLCAQL